MRLMLRLMMPSMPKFTSSQARSHQVEESQGGRGCQQFADCRDPTFLDFLPFHRELISLSALSRADPNFFNEMSLSTLYGSGLISTIVVKSSPEQKQSLSTLVDPQSGRSSHRGGKLFPVWAVSFLLVMVIGDGDDDDDHDGDDDAREKCLIPRNRVHCPC